MTSENLKILIYGYGNPGRQDDGLGILLSEHIDQWAREQGLINVHTDSNYQLNLEDAAGIAAYDMVIFADATQKDVPGFLMEPLEPSSMVEFTMHAVAPSFILHLSRQIFERSPESFLMHIQGFQWEFMGEMTEQAHMNLNAALDYLKKFILNRLST